MEVAAKEGTVNISFCRVIYTICNMHIEKLNNQGLLNYQNRTLFKEEIVSTFTNAREERLS